MASNKPTDFASYCAGAQPFARPVLKKVRSLWRQAAPKASEAMKWGSPCFEGRSLLGGSVAFKAHVSLWLWRSGDIEGAPELFPVTKRTGMGSLKVASLDELPPDRVLLKLFRGAVKVDAEGATSATKKAPAKKAPRVVAPKDFAAALKAVPAAASHYKALSPSCKREYVEWIGEAEREATRSKRIATAVEWISEGKDRNWRYR